MPLALKAQILSWKCYWTTYNLTIESCLLRSSLESTLDNIQFSHHIKPIPGRHVNDVHVNVIKAVLKRRDNKIKDNNLEIQRYFKVPGSQSKYV